MKPSPTAVEAVAWDRLAQAFDYYHRTGIVPKDAYGQFITPTGICCGIWSFPPRTYEAAQDRMIREGRATRKPVGYWWPSTRTYAARRAAFCRRMAEQCRSEL